MIIIFFWIVLMGGIWLLFEIIICILFKLITITLRYILLLKHNHTKSTETWVVKTTNRHHLFIWPMTYRHHLFIWPMSRVLPARVSHNLQVSSSPNTTINSAFLLLTSQITPAPSPQAPEKRLTESYGRKKETLRGNMWDFKNFIGMICWYCEDLHGKGKSHMAPRWPQTFWRIFHHFSSYRFVCRTLSS